MDEKLELILGQNAGGSERDTSEVMRIKEERLSTQKCLQICAQLSEHISQVQITARQSASNGTTADSMPIPERITNEGLRECKESLARMAQQLASHETQLFDRLMSMLDTASASQENATDITRLREEWQSTRKSMDILSTASNHMEKNISIIENHGTGDAVQIMVSTNGKAIHGINRGLGWRTRQIGGYVDNETVRQMSRDMVSISIRDADDRQPPPRGETPTVSDDRDKDARQSQFKERYGGGFKLASESPSDISIPPA